MFFVFLLSWVYYAFKHMFGKYLSINLFVYLFVVLISLLSVFVLIHFVSLIV